MDEVRKVNHVDNLKFYAKEIAKYTGIITSVVLLSWFILWAAKEMSYVFMYEDMVEQTIRENVHPEYLRDYIK